MEPLFDDEPRPERVKIRFSLVEVGHIALAVVILTIAFTMVLAEPDGFTPRDALERLMAPWQLYMASFFAVSSGFVFHELGHKIVAQRYGHWAEFRGQFGGLGISLAFAAGMGLLFAAPGAVMIWGRVSNRQNGIISLMGPAINFVIALLAFPFALAVDREALLPKTMGVIALVNAVLCLFNLLPILNLDGRKIWHWNKFVYIVSMLAAVALLIGLVNLDIRF